MSVFTSCDASAAENAFAGIANDGRRELVDRDGSTLALIFILACSGYLSDVQQLAAAVFAALLALHRVIGEQQLDRRAASLHRLRRRYGYLHTLGDGIYAGGDESARTGRLYKADAAGAVIAFAVIICTEGGNLVAAAFCCLENGQSFLYLIGIALYFYIDQRHTDPPD